jgi:hypothetical protein
MMENPDEGDEAAELLRYEQERIDRRDAASWKVVGWWWPSRSRCWRTTAGARP